MAETTNTNILQFATFQSFIHATFWHKLAEIKLNYDRLSDAPKTISGYYTNRNAKSCLLEVDYSAFDSQVQPPKFHYAAHGIIYNKNTIEDFKECDKKALLAAEGQKLLTDFNYGHVLDKPSLLARFFILTFADLKSHTYYYWFAFPCPLTSTLSVQKANSQLKDLPNYEIYEDILKRVPYEEQQFFVLYVQQETVNYQTLKCALNAENFKIDNIDDYYFCFADASEYEHPAWLMRTYSAFLYKHCPHLIGKNLNFLGIRYDNRLRPAESRIWQVMQNEADATVDGINFVGWEVNRNNKMGPRMVCMRDSMDPAKLAENSVNLNLKLMKWRLVPELNLDIIVSTKCLLFGAGTLGCAVSRNLLSWGFRYITLLDNGNVGYSNPVRQNLYTHADAAAGNKMKAVTAAERLREINPSVQSNGYNVQIPMPGHTIGETLRAKTSEDLELIAKLVQQHDVLFLLTDSRESRWLPTLLGAAYSKIVLNAALGFDSYLVMRHGSTRISEFVGDNNVTSEIGGLKCITGNNLGCYFCNDVTAPGNSLRDRTLDQQCTVTRPGVSNIAASYAVELLVSILQHPQKELAPAYYANVSNTNAKTPESLLGILPHSIRGMLCNYENILPATQKFTQCIACSEKILNEYKMFGNEFLFKVFETTKYVEDLTGISDYKALDNKIIDFDDSDLEISDD